MALFSIRNSCLAVIGLLAFATVACASGKDDDTQATTTDDDDNNDSGDGTAGKGGDDDDDTAATGGASSVPNPTYINTFTSLMDVNSAEPANTTPPENDLTVDPNTKYTLDDTDGAPAESDKPSMKIVAPFSEFTSPDQAIDFQFKLQGAPVDLSGKTLFLYLKLDSGFVQDPSAPGGFIFYAKSGSDWVWGQAAWQNLDPNRTGKWWRYQFTLADAEPGEGGAKFDPSQVMSIGLKIDTGSPTSTPSSQPTEATFHLDSLGYVDDGTPLP
jgi:hypothetical protein